MGYDVEKYRKEGVIVIKNRKYYTNLVKFGFAKWEKMSEEEKKEYYEKKKEAIECPNIMEIETMIEGKAEIYKTSDDDISNNDFVRMGMMKNLEILDKIRGYLNIFFIFFILGIVVGVIWFLISLIGMSF